VIVAKAIKPARMKDARLRAILLNKQRSVGNKIKKDFEKTTATWDKKPKFEVVMAQRPDGPEVAVWTDNEVYGFVNFGTEEHIIEPVNAKVLAFPETYTAKTIPGVIGSQSGGSSGETVFAAYVLHPGTKARHFDREIARIWEPRFRREMEQGMRDAAKASGHSI
jgi:hypothetical protein